MLCLETNILFYKLVDLEKKLLTFYFLIPEKWSLNLEKLCPSEGEDEAFICISRGHMINESHDSVGKAPSL